MTPALSVVIATHRRRELLPELLGALAVQDATAGSFEVVMVDNDSPDGTYEWLRGLSIPWLRVLQEKRRGPACARNAGWRAALAPQVLFLDDDMLPGPNVLRLHAEAFARNPKASYLGYVDNEWGTYTHPLSRYVALTMGARFFPAQDGAQATFYQYLTQNVSSPREALERVGGFEESFSGYGNEDPELGYRLHRAGVPLLFLRGAEAVHRDRHDPAAWWQKRERMGHSQAHFLHLHPELGELDRGRYLSGRLGPLWSAYRALAGDALDRAAARAPAHRPLPAWVRLHYRISTSAYLHRGFTRYWREAAAK